MDWAYYFILVLLLLFGLCISVIGLPGLWLIVAAHGAYAFATGWDVHVGWASLGALIVLASIAEAVEFLAGAAGSKSAGGRKRGMIGAVIGGLLGAIFLTVMIPIPLVGTIIGVCAGTFLGAGIAEFSDRDAGHALRVGIGAAKGRLYGMIGKLVFGVAMLGVSLVTALPTGALVANPSVPAPASQRIASTKPDAPPATAPATVP